MKRTFLCCCVLIISALGAFAQTKPYDTNSVIMTRILERDLFDANSVPFMQPLVTTLNTASNSRFYNQAFVPSKVDKIYFKFGIHTMVGFVRDDQLEFTPSLPTEKRPFAFLDPKYVTVNPNFTYSIKDTAGLAVAVVKRLFQKGIEKGYVVVPAKAATFFGSTNARVSIKNDSLAGLLSSDPEFSVIFNAMDSVSKSRIVNSIVKLPDLLTLPPGQNMRSVFAAVPQLEIGAWRGTELLLRYIPPIEWDTSIGKFSFYGVAIKHSLSQYFKDTTFNLAVQIGMQGTSLSNTVGVTQAKLEATANFFDINIHASKKLGNICEVFTGFDYASTSIRSTYSYVLPVELQLKLGLLRLDSTDRTTAVRDPANGYPGDDVVQVSESRFSDATFRWTFGLFRTFGPFAVFVDYSISKFNIFSGGLEFRF